MTKRIATLVLLTVIRTVLCGIPATGFAQQSGTDGNIAWSLDDGTLTISGTGEMPDYNDDAMPWSEVRYQVDRVVINNGITRIGNLAFIRCSMKSVTIPESVTSIGEWAFHYCQSLASVTIPGNVTVIGYSAFSYCENLTSINVAAANAAYASVDGVVYDKTQTTLCIYPAGKTSPSFTIPQRVTTIGDRAFHSCTNLTSVTIPESVTSIEKRAFQSCEKLTSVTIPQGITAIEEEVFFDCFNLASVTIPESVTSIGYGAFSACLNLTSILIPQKVTTIEEYAFYGCDSVTSITIPKSVTRIGYGAFSGWEVQTAQGPWKYAYTKLREVNVDWADPSDVTLEDDPFANVILSPVTLYVPGGAQAAYQAAPVWKDFGTITATSNVPVAVPAVKIFVAGKTLYLDTPSGEMVDIYSVAGALLYQTPKPAGETQILLDAARGAILIVKGRSGWTVKVAVP